jgi:hypothetical protein
LLLVELGLMPRPVVEPFAQKALSKGTQDHWSDDAVIGRPRATEASAEPPSTAGTPPSACHPLDEKRPGLTIAPSPSV